MIKAAMLRTCGVTGDEFRGAAGHSLRALMEQTGLRSPVPIGELERLSKAPVRNRNRVNRRIPIQADAKKFSPWEIFPKIIAVFS